MVEVLLFTFFFFKLIIYEVVNKFEYENNVMVLSVTDLKSLKNDLLEPSAYSFFVSVI